MRSASTIAVLIGIVLGSTGAASQTPEEAPPRRPGARSDAAATLQAEVEVRYLRLQGLMTKLLEAIDKAEETGRVAVALDRAEELKVSERLREIQTLLGAKDYRSALEEEKAVEKDLERILRILKGLDEAEELKRAAEELDALREDLERLGRLSVEEEKQLEETRGLDSESLSPDDPRAKEESSLLSRKQQDIQRRTDALRKSLERSGENAGRKDSEQDAASREGEKGAGEEGDQGEAGEAKEGGGGKEGGKGGKQGQGKTGKGGKQGGKSGGKSGQGKQGGKQGQAKSGESSQGEESQGQSSAGKKAGGESEQKDRRQARASSRAKAARALRRATERMEGASQRLQAGNLKGAEEDEEEALAELEQAAEDLEEEIERREEENQEELARRLIQRLEAMLAEQEVVSLETKYAHRRSGDGKPREEPEPSAKEKESGPKAMDEAEEEPADPRSLARRERSLVTEAEDALRILEADETSVTAPSIIERVRDDLGNVATLLEGGETGEVTQLIQSDIERTLRELIEALTPPERPPGPPGPPPQPRPRGKRKDLVSPVSEIKMLRASQGRLRERTEKLEELGLLPGKAAEPAPEPSGDTPPPLVEQARKLAEAQAKLAGLMDALVAKYPVIDQLLLGAENDLVEENREPAIPLLPPPPEDGDRGPRLEGSPGKTPPEKGDGE